MAKQSNTELQKTWEERITKAKKRKDDWRKQFNVDTGLSYYEGKQNPGEPDGEWYTINKIWSHLQSQLPSLYSVDPYFYVRTKKSFNPDPKKIAIYDARGHIRQSYLNYLKGELELKPKARLCIQDAFFAFGVIKTHYYADQKKNPDYGKPLYDAEGNELKSDDGEALMEPESIPVNDRYCITRVHFDDFLWDEDAGPLSDKWCWVAERVRLTRDQAKRRFNKATLKKMKPQDDKKDGAQAKSSYFSLEGEKKDQDIYVLWEIYDLKNKEWLTICEGGSEPIESPDSLPPGVENHPYSILRFCLHHNSAYPIPPVSQAIDPQRELCTARSRVMKHRKRFNRKYEVLVTGLEDADIEIAKLETGDDGTCIRKTQPTQIVTPIQDAPLAQQDYLEIQAINNDLVEIFGSGDEARGIAGADSATQADIIDRRLEIREGDRMSLVSDFLTDIARKLDQLVKAHITRDEAVRIVGPEGENWQIVRAEDYQDIDGEFEYGINVGATAPRLPQTERAQWTAFMSQVIIPMPHVLTAPHFMRRMAEMYGIEDQAALDELRQIGQQMMSGQVPMPGGQGGSQAGVPTQNPVSAILGMAAGPMGGNTNGGGAPGGMAS